MGSKNTEEREEDFKTYLKSNDNYELLHLFEYKVLNIQYIPEKIKEVLFKDY